MKKPNFFVIGAGKAATTSLCKILSAHPNVFFSNPKEPGFFSLQEKFNKGYEWYESLFSKVANEKAIGEGSTTYSIVGVYPEVVDRIADYSPSSKIIYILREPFSRLESQWIQWRSMGIGESRDFLTAIKSNKAYIESSMYWKQIEAYKRRFSDDKILVLLFDEFKEDPVGITNKCFKFLNVDQVVFDENIYHPTNTWKNKRQDSLVLDMIKRIPFYSGFRDTIVPRGIRRLLKPVVTIPIKNRPSWDLETKEWVSERIRDDIKKALEYAGKPKDFWML